MSKIRKNRKVVVTLCDNKFVPQAKQLFSSLYFNAKWSGDCLLLAHNVSEKKLDWFKKRGVIIKKCKPLFKKNIGFYSPVLTSKIYLFTNEFKKWTNVIYLDTDIIVRASVDGISNTDNFLALPEVENKTILDQFTFDFSNNYKESEKIFSSLSKQFDLELPAFNAGVIAFNTKIIKKDTFKNIKKMLYKFGRFCKFGDQGIQNLYFSSKWSKLQESYNLYPEYISSRYKINEKKCKGIILHFVGDSKFLKPWNVNNPYYKEWKHNLDLSSSIDFRRKIKNNKCAEMVKVLFIKSNILLIKLKYYFFLLVKKTKIFIKEFYF